MIQLHALAVPENHNVGFMQVWYSGDTCHLAPEALAAPEEFFKLAKNNSSCLGIQISGKDGRFDYRPILGPYTTEVFLLDNALVVFNEVKPGKFIYSGPEKVLTVVSTQETAIRSFAEKYDLPLEARV